MGLAPPADAAPKTAAEGAGVIAYGLLHTLGREPDLTFSVAAFARC
jgi:hypothetical protein